MTTTVNGDDDDDDEQNIALQQFPRMSIDINEVP